MRAQEETELQQNCIEAMGNEGITSTHVGHEDIKIHLCVRKKIQEEIKSLTTTLEVYTKMITLSTSGNYM